MNIACRPDGTEYGYYDAIRIGYVACAERPDGQVFTGTVSIDPAIMWRPKTQAEIDAENAQDITNKLNTEKLTKLLFSLLLDHENRIAKLEGKPIVPAAQYRAAVIKLY